MKKVQCILVQIISYFFILLFFYASVSKILDFENFQVQIGQSPLLSAYAGTISYAVIILELITVLLLIIPKTNLLGLHASTSLMSAFTVYIFLILYYSDFVPCSCGGVLEKMGWTEHLIFNIICVIAGVLAVIISQKRIQYLRNFTYTSLLITNVFSIVMVIVLFFSSEHIIKHENNFTRRFLQQSIIKDKILKLADNQYYFAGSDDQNIYLGSRKYPQKMITVNKGLGKMDSIRIMPDRTHYTFKNLQLHVKNPFYYLSDGTVPVIFRGRIGDSQAKTISYNDAFFSQIQPIDSLSFIIRTQNSFNKQLTLGILNLSSPSKIQLYPHILQKQSDGVFDSDGKLVSGNNPDRIGYIYSYRNKFLILSKHLKSLQEFKTIDTVSRAKIRTTALSNGQHKMSAPPLHVNQSISVCGNTAMVQSRLRGRSESAKSWKNSKVIDLYRTDRQEYMGSFYIYNRGSKSLSDYMLTEKFLYTIIGNELIRYQYQEPVN